MSGLLPTFPVHRSDARGELTLCEGEAISAPSPGARPRASTGAAQSSLRVMGALTPFYQEAVLWEVPSQPGLLGSICNGMDSPLGGGKEPRPIRSLQSQI